MITSILFTIGGILLLYAGAEMLVRGSVALSHRLRVRPLLIGLIVIGLGTSSPELVVSIQATLTGSGEIAVGNILGSNISNLALILGLAVLFRPITADRELLKRDIPVMIAVSGLMTVMLWNGMLTRLDGFLLLAGLILYMVITIRLNFAPHSSDSDHGPGTYGVSFVLAATLAGGVILLLGANLIVKGAAGIALRLDIPEGIVGLTIVAVGTSLPELAAAIVAAVRRQGELILGALIGSNILNVLFVLGVTGAIRAVQLRDIMPVDLIIMMLLTVLMIPIIRTGYVIDRRKGALLLIIYAGYLGYLFIR